MSVLAEAIVPSGGDWVSPDMPYAEFRKAGHTFAMRYAVPSIVGKMVTRTEVLAAHVSGVDVGLIYETTGATWRGGVAGGTADGEAARQALESLGAPHSVACYHAVDSQVADSDMWLVRGWLTRIRDVMKPYRTGVYGQASVIDMARTLDPAIYRWQTQAWSAGRVSQWTEILQLGSTSIAGINIDLDLAYTPDFGQWYANPARQPQPGKEDPMPSGVIAENDVFSVPLADMPYTTLTLYCDIGLLGNQPQKVRVALFSKSAHYSQIIDHIITTNTPTPITLEARDVVGVSFSRHPGDGEGNIGYLFT